MLIGEGLPVGGVESDVLRGAFKGGAVAEELAIRSPAGAFLGLFAEVAQIGNGFFAEDAGIFHAVDQGIHQTAEALAADDGEILAELLDRTHPPTEEVAEGQLHNTAVGEAAVELALVFLAAPEGPDEFPHRQLALAHLGGFDGADHLGVGLGDVPLKHLAVGGPDHFGLFAAGEAGAHHEALGSLSSEGVDRRQLQALVHGAAEPCAAGGGGNLQFLEQHVEVVDDEVARLRLPLEQASAGSPHLLQGHVGGGQRAGFFEHVPQAAGVDGQDAGIAGNDGVADVAQEPGQVADRLLHPLGAVAADADRSEAGRQDHPHIGIATGAFKQPAQQVAAVSGGTGEGLHRALEGGLVCCQGRTRASSVAGEGGIEVGERRAARKDAVGGFGDDRSSIGREALGHRHPDLATLEEGGQGVEFAAVGEAILLLRLTDAGERQGVVALGGDPGAAAAGGHGHERERAGLRNVTAGSAAHRPAMNKCLQPTALAPAPPSPP